MRDELTIQINEIIDRLEILIKDSNMLEDLEMALSVQDFDQEKINAIKQSATQTTFNQISDGQGTAFETTLSKDITHAYKHPILMSISILNAMEFADYSDEKSTLASLRELKSAMEDNVHNYPRLLVEDMPGTVQNTLDDYSNIIPELNQIITDIAKDLKVTLTDIDLKKSGIEHLTKLDEDAFPPYVPD